LWLASQLTLISSMLALAAYPIRVRDTSGIAIADIF
jgi:hypothetical protein